MSYALLVFIPFTTASGAYLVRRTRNLAALLSLASVVVELVLAINLSASGQILGIGVDVHPITKTVLVGTLILAGTIFLYAWQIGQDSTFFATGLSVLGSLTAAILLLREPLMASAFIVLSTLFAAFGLLSETTSERHISTAMLYVSSMVVAGVCLLTTFVIMGEYSVDREPILARVGAAGLLMGLAILLGACPFHHWLPGLVEKPPAAIAAFLVGPVAVGSVGLSIVTVDRYPWLLTDERTRDMAMLIGTLAAIGGALLAISQRSLPRLLALSIASASGFTIVGLASGSELGIGGAVFSTLSNAWSAVLVLACVGQLGSQGPGLAGLRLQTWKNGPSPSLLGLLVGGFSLVGVPPLSGFVGRWMIYQAAAARTTYLALALIAASAILFLAYARVFPQLLANRDGAVTVGEETPVLAGMILLLTLFSVAVGLYPAPILQALSDILREMPLLQGV